MPTLFERQTARPITVRPAQHGARSMHSRAWSNKYHRLQCLPIMTSTSQQSSAPMLDHHRMGAYAGLRWEIQTSRVLLKDAHPDRAAICQTDKESLAGVWACEKFDHFLCDPQFKLLTDHKPVLPMVNSKHQEEEEEECFLFDPNII